MITLFVLVILGGLDSALVNNASQMPNVLKLFMFARYAVLGKAMLVF